MIGKYLIVSGKKIHYDRLHGDIRKTYGNAIRCEFCNTKTAKRYEWALKKGCSYSMNISDYIPLCPSCHRKYDMTEELKNKMRTSMKGKRIGGKNPSARKVIDVKSKIIFDTVSDAAKSVNIKRSTLTMMLNGTNRNKTNFIYYEQS